MHVNYRLLLTSKVYHPIFSRSSGKIGSNWSQMMENIKNIRHLSQGKHIEITSNSSRDVSICNAVVKEIYPLSPTVMGFNLSVKDKCTFQAGQWVDVFIPNMETVGGFSICCSPLHFNKTSIISLAIKKSTWPPAKWFHGNCSIGSEVSLRVGGDFYFPNFNSSVDEFDLLLVGGGVGLNPIYSIYSHYCCLRRESKYKRKVSLLVTAKSEAELLFKTDIDKQAKQFPEEIGVQYFTTGDQSSNTNIKHGRISQDDIRNALTRLDIDKTKAYICGPPSMIETIERFIKDNSKPSLKTYSEKWW